MLPELSGAAPNEPLTPFHRAAGGHVAADGGDPARRLSRLPFPAIVGAARGRLPDDPDHDAVSGCEPRGHDLVGDRAARAPVRPDAGVEPDVVDEFGRR